MPFVPAFNCIQLQTNATISEKRPNPLGEDALNEQAFIEESQLIIAKVAFPASAGSQAWKVRERFLCICASFRAEYMNKSSLLKKDLIHLSHACH
jgi:hypothetical protein